MIVHKGPWATLQDLFEEVFNWAKEVQGTVYAADDPTPNPQPHSDLIGLLVKPPRLGWRVVPSDPSTPVHRWSVTAQDLARMRRLERSLS